MAKLTVAQQVEKLLDGRPYRWLSLEIKIPESEVSRKMNGKVDFTNEEIERINKRLNGSIAITTQQTTA